jgi:hypothetical protein
MKKNVKCLLLNVDTVLISEVIEIDAELGDPNCKLTNPFLWKKREASDEFYLEPWIEASNQKELMIRSEDILTIADPIPEVIEKYLELTT